LKTGSAVKVTFWLLDINSETREDVPEVWLWGVTANNNRVLIVDRNFVAHFCAVVEEGFDPSRVAAEINKALRDSVVRTEIAPRKLFGKPVNTVKVYCRKPDEVSKLSKAVRTLEGVKDCLEDDIRPSMQYLIDNNVVPCGWYEIEATEEKNIQSARVDKVCLAESSPKPRDRPEVPPLRIINFSMTCYSREGSPKPDRNPVIIISIRTSEDEEKQFTASEDRNDKILIQEFLNYVKKFDPDVIVSYGANNIDWMYLKERCKHLGLKLDIDRMCTEPHTSVYGHVSLTGTANLDLADFADEFPEVKVKTLQNLADHLGVMKLTEHALIEDVDFADYWEDKRKREDLKSFSLDNASRVKGVGNMLLDFGMQLSSLVGLPLDHVVTAAAGFRVEWFMIRRAEKTGELVPKRIEQPYRPYAGGIVLTPKAGLHENIAVLDFKSMYPNIMIAFNLSPDTYVSPEDPAPRGGVFEAPEVNHRFRKEPAGFYKEALLYLIGARGEIRAKMKTLDPKTAEYRVLDARQKAVKVITNAAYGYAGWIGARWYNKPVAEAAAAWGRHSILTSIKMAEAEGLKVIYGDTDSLFVSYDEKKTKKLEAEIGKTLGLEIEQSQLYVRILFTEAKKRYAGLLEDGSLDIVGLEVIRGDWANVAKKVQEHVLEIVLKDQSPEEAVDFVDNVMIELRERKVPFRDLIIWKTLTKPVEEYAIKASHVEAAKMLKAKGWNLTIGDKVGYVILTGEGRLYERVKPYVFASYKDIDVEYYVSKQVVPAAARVLEFFGITEEELLNRKRKEKHVKSLMEFMS
jgi:DNA polymerase I